MGFLTNNVSFRKLIILAIRFNNNTGILIVKQLW